MGGEGAGTGLIGRQWRVKPGVEIRSQHKPKSCGAGTGEDEGEEDPPLSSIRSHSIPFLRHLRMITLEQ